MDDFYLPFGDGLRRDNRWVKTVALMPGELVDEIYAQSMYVEKERDAIPSRVAFDAEYIKEQENHDGIGVCSDNLQS